MGTSTAAYINTGDSGQTKILGAIRMSKAIVLSFVVGLLGVSQALPRRSPFLGRIVGGAEVAPGELPFQIALLYYGELLCGGSIYNEEWIVTAAHCAVYASSASAYSIRAGVHNLRFPEDDSQVINVALNFVHEDYSDSGYGNDIAIMKLETPLTLSPANRTGSIPLAKAGTAISGDLQVSGWGRLDSGGLLPAKLRAVKVPYVDDDACREAYGSTIEDSMICAGAPEGGKDSCQGDSGGPLTAVIDGQTTLVGIVSWGRGCAEAGYPGVYAEVSYFQKWVVDKIAANK